MSLLNDLAVAASRRRQYLAEAATATSNLDQLISQARTAGHSWRRIASVTLEDENTLRMRSKRDRKRRPVS